MDYTRIEKFGESLTMWYLYRHDRANESLLFLVLRLSDAAGGGRIAIELSRK
jgi:hypothetical protein